MFSAPPGAPGPGLSPSLRAGGRPYSGGGGEGRKAGAVVAPCAPAGLVVAPGSGGRPPGLPRPRSNGEGDRPAGPGGAAVTPVRGRPPGVGLLRSNGVGDHAAGALVSHG